LIHHLDRESQDGFNAISHLEPLKAANVMRQQLQKVEDRLLGRT
jgi:hypothetical protein